MSIVNPVGFLSDGTPILDTEGVAAMEASGWHYWWTYPAYRFGEDHPSVPPSPAGARTEFVSGENGGIAWMRITDPEGVVVFEMGDTAHRPKRRRR
jgi:hypothetical protein